MQTRPAEDIDAVLGRFQAWAGSRNAVEAKPGIRELSCEDALQSRRYRWKAADETLAKKKPDVEPGVVRAGAPVTAQTAVSAPEAAQKKTAPAEVRSTRRSATKKARTGGHAAKLNREARSVSAQKPVPVAKAGFKATTEAKLEFRDVLAATVRPVEVMITAQPVEISRQVAISIRLAPAERALIKTRAAEAGITASAYIRQCALELEQLRAQVQQTLAALERNPRASNPNPARAPGFFTRLVRRFFPGTTSSLALRA